MSRVSTLRAPREDGALVAEPPLSEVAALLEENRRRRLWAGPRFQQLYSRARATRTTIEAAWNYLRQFDPALPALSSERPLLVAGHQPELFHPGVWVKSFALHGLAARHGLIALNLIIDNDTVKNTSIRVPSYGKGTPHLASVPFDRWTKESPWEERPIRDPECFAAFPEQVLRELRGWDCEPMLSVFWKEVQRLAAVHANPGVCFAAARRAVERRWGCHNLEVPVSVLSATEPFAWFACDLLLALPQFRVVYNECLAAYRQTHGIHSRSHPVPDLAEDGSWLEAPFWGWRAGQTRRGRLFVRRHGDRLELRSGADDWPALAVPSGDSAKLVQAWRRLESEGFKVRPRALTNTLFARLFLADLFIHGIGGGKYDELTDEIIRRFYECEPPHYLVLTGTRLLPLPTTPVSEEDCRRLAREARDIHWNPQRYLAADAASRALLAEKAAWIEREPTSHEERRQRFEKLRSLTEKLREPLVQREHELREQLQTCEKQLETNAVLRRRDYSFVLYPEAMLREFCTQFL